MRGTNVLLVLACLLGGASQARAGTVTLFDGTLHADPGASFPQGVTPGLDGPGGYGGGTLEGDTRVTAPYDGMLTISVQDLGAPGNVYEVILDQSSLGTTKKVSVGGASSSGVFTANVLAGDHVIGLWDFILTYLGGDSPYGGTVGDDFSVTQPLQLTVTESSSTSVPEPGSATLLAVGAAALVLAVRRRAGPRHISQS